MGAGGNRSDLAFLFVLYERESHSCYFQIILNWDMLITSMGIEKQSSDSYIIST